MHSIVKYCFPFFPISRILRGTHRMDLFVEVTNQIPKENICITTSWCCFKTMHIDWDNIMVTGISGIKIDMTSGAKVSIFTDNDLTLMMIILR